MLNGEIVMEIGIKVRWVSHCFLIPNSDMIFSYSPPTFLSPSISRIRYPNHISLPFCSLH